MLDLKASVASWGLGSEGASEELCNLSRVYFLNFFFRFLSYLRYINCKDYCLPAPSLALSTTEPVLVV